MGNDEKETEGNQTQEENKVLTQVLTYSWEKIKQCFDFTRFDTYLTEKCKLRMIFSIIITSCEPLWKKSQ